MVGKRGRPAKSNTTININDLSVEFISKKENNYNANICYFKVVDIDAKNKMKPIRSLEEDDVRMPYWKTTDKKDIILKVKDKFVNYSDDLESGCLYTANLDFEYYTIEDLENDKSLKGYYLKVQGLHKVQMVVEIADDDSN
jgi:hypothetical protein